jgi:hypothetical protein
MTHGAILEAEHLKLGIKDNLVRLSVRIEPTFRTPRRLLCKEHLYEVQKN